MYLAVFDHAVSLVLLRQHEEVQRLVFYLSKMLADVETQYLSLEKLALAFYEEITTLFPSSHDMGID